MEPQKKVGAIALCLLFAIASMSLISSIVRFVVNAHYATRIGKDPKVFSFVSWHLAFWQYLEIIFAVVAYGLTTARHYFRVMAAGANRVSRLVSRNSWSLGSKTSLKRHQEHHERYSDCYSHDSKGVIHITEQIDVEKATLPEFHNPQGRREEW